MDWAVCSGRPQACAIVMAQLSNCLQFWTGLFLVVSERYLYASSADGAQYCRPWQLAWRADFGCSGYLEPEHASKILELMCSEGFPGSWQFYSFFSLNVKKFFRFRLMTDPDLPGTEKISVCQVPNEYLDAKYEELPSTIGGPFLVVKFMAFSIFILVYYSFKLLAGGSLLPPFSVGYCKGWKRSVMALIVLQGIRELGLTDAIQHRIKAIHRSPNF